MSYETIECTRDDAVGRIVFDRADAHNAMNEAMGEEMADAAQTLASDDDVRCIALTANGPTFNTGADLTTLSGDGSDEPRLRAIASGLHEFMSQLVHAPKPVVTGVDGVAAGGGLGPSICGDIVLAAESARFEFAYPRIGFCGDGGSTYLLPRLVGLRRAQEIVFRDEPIDSAEADSIGLVTEVVDDADLEDRVTEEATRLASGPTKGYGEAKRLLTKSLDTALDSQLADEGKTIARLSNTEDFSRGHAAFNSDESPDFVGE
ncbi:MAG: enoyl-CoA hydratase-related protein [Natronomonas sp.]